MSRVELQPCWVLHRRAWRESSLLVEILTPVHGRLGVVARSARAARSPWRGLAEPFIPLQASWVRRGDMGTLTALEPVGDSVRLVGRALWCGLYVNELVLRLTARDDPSPELFTLYGHLMLAMTETGKLAVALRRFELALLDLLGVMPDLAREADSDRAVLAEGLYHVDPERGPVPAAGPGRHVFSGELLLALAHDRIDEGDLAARSRALTRLLLDRQLGGKPLHTRSLFAGPLLNRTAEIEGDS
ncbi:MAG: DNA repair protein RecO [Wenzhouxiangella sp.]|nr:MAG: DNA repair protein RecO [Wenzhouxiangella sp.]